MSFALLCEFANSPIIDAFDRSLDAKMIQGLMNYRDVYGYREAIGVALFYINLLKSLDIEIPFSWVDGLKELHRRQDAYADLVINGLEYTTWEAQTSVRDVARIYEAFIEANHLFKNMLLKEDAIDQKDPPEDYVFYACFSNMGTELFCTDFVVGDKVPSWVTERVTQMTIFDQAVLFLRMFGQYYWEVSHSLVRQRVTQSS